MKRRTVQRPRFLCEGCGGIIVAAVAVVDVTALEIRHAASCRGPGVTRLVTDPALDPGRRRWGEQRAAAYAAAHPEMIERPGPAIEVIVTTKRAAK